ncbi:hypothetical protein [Paenibacillus sp. GCM10027626]|uniref:hypothetical protein n=1 Tax=Paenibacillus sp. GCM10027626 TaxID=3273411 RepID=UPI00363C681B
MIGIHNLQSSGGLVANLGSPRSCGQQQWSCILHSYRNGLMEEQQFINHAARLRQEQIRLQLDAGLDFATVGDFSYYDYVLDQAVAFGLVPERFRSLASATEIYMAMAFGRRGQAEPIAACSRKSWFKTKQHYVVPEWEPGTMPSLTYNYWLDAVLEAPADAHSRLRPVIIGPYTFAGLLQSAARQLPTQSTILHTFIPVYAQLLHELAGTAIEWVQFDEPALTFAGEDDYHLIHDVYSALQRNLAQLCHNSPTKKLNIMVQTYFGAVRSPAQLFQLPVEGIGLDLAHDNGSNLQQLHQLPPHKWLGAGVIDSSPWRSDLTAIWQLIERLQSLVPADRLILQPAGSLSSLPLTVKEDTASPPLIRLTKAFAHEKLLELNTLACGLKNGKKTILLDLTDSDIMKHALAASSDHAIIQAIGAPL